MAELPETAVERLIKKAGAPRVGKDAVDALLGILEAEAARISGKAVKLTRHAGRVTVTADDIKLAASE